jgi:hypothetical protein
MNVEKLHRFTELETRRRQLQEELRAVDAESLELEAELLSEFERAGIQNMKVNGVTVYLHRQVWANAREGDYDRACAALLDAGLPELVERRFNTNRLSAWVRERTREGEEIPDALKDGIEISERFSIRTRKG